MAATADGAALDAVALEDVAALVAVLAGGFVGVASRCRASMAKGASTLTGRVSERSGGLLSACGGRVSA